MLKINELKRLDLGVKGENESKTLQIDMSAWASLYPNATAEILHKRSGDNTKALTGATYDSDTMILTWMPTDTDTFYEGFGVAEIRMVEGSVVKKTKDLIVTAVCPSIIDGSGTIIESTYQAFLNSVISTKQEAVAAKNDAETAQGMAEDAADDAEASADDAAASAAIAESAAIHQPEISKITGNWMVWDWEAGEYVDTSVHAQGPQGEPGMIENVRATGIKMSMEDDTTVYDAINAKPDVDDIPTKVSELTNDSGYITSHQDITGKADKVSGATSGNFAGLDENGNLTDSGSKASDFITSHQDITGKADKVSEATSGNFAGLDSNGNLTDSGHKHSDYLTSHQDISGKADKTEVNAAEAGYAIVIDGNTAPKAITAGQYLFIKNHSTLASGGYHATAAIASGGSISSSNVAEDADGLVNAAYSTLNGKIAHIDTSTKITSLDNIPLNTKGRIYLGSAISPNGADDYFNYICYGNASKVTLKVTKPSSTTGNDKEYRCSNNNGTWSGWYSIDDQISTLNSKLNRSSVDFVLSNGLFASSNAHSVVRNEYTRLAVIDATVGSSNIPAWTKIGTSSVDKTMETMVTIYNASSSTMVACPYAAWDANGISLPIALSAGTRYIIRVYGF